MDLNRFKACSAAWGADRRRWPPGDQPIYDRFAGTAEGAAILADAGRTDRFLDALEPVAPDPRRARQVAALARPDWVRLARPAAVLAASAVFGFVVGFAQARNAADTDAAARLLLGPASLHEIGL